MRGTLTANYKKDRLYQCRCYEITTRCNWTTKVFTAGYAIVFPNKSKVLLELDEHIKLDKAQENELIHKILELDDEAKVTNFEIDLKTDEIILTDFCFPSNTGF